MTHFGENTIHRLMYERHRRQVHRRWFLAGVLIFLALVATAIILLLV